MPVGCWLCLARAQNPGSVGYKETEGGAPNEEVYVNSWAPIGAPETPSGGELCSGKACGPAGQEENDH